MFTIKADATGVVPAECVGTAAVPCVCRRPPSAVTPSLYAYGLTAPKGGVTFVPDAKTNEVGGHLWAADHSQGLCRMDVVKDLTGATGPARVQLGSLRRRHRAGLRRADRL